MVDLEDIKIDQTNDAFLDHLEELRKRSIFSILVLVALSVISYIFSNEILSFLTRPLSLISQKVYFLSPYDAFVVKLQIAFWAGVFLASPLLLTELWLFIAPGLYKRERRFFLLSGNPMKRKGSRGQHTFSSGRWRLFYYLRKGLPSHHYVM